MATVLERIEEAGRAVADELGIDVLVEKDDRGRLPLVSFRPRGFLPTRDAPAEHGRDM
jgi:hypothetical protein